MQGLTLFNLNLTHLLDAFLETAVPMIAGLAEVVGHFDIKNTSAPGTFGVIMPLKAMIETVGSIRHFQLLNLPVFRKLIEIAVDRALADVGVLLNDGIVYLFSGGM